MDVTDPPVRALHRIPAFPVTAGFYRTCAIDGILHHSPAEHVRRPQFPAGSPTPGFTYLQLEALLTAARESANPYDSALVTSLRLPRLMPRKTPDIADESKSDMTTLRSLRGEGMAAGLRSGRECALRPTPVKLMFITDYWRGPGGPGLVAATGRRGSNRWDNVVQAKMLL